MNHRPKALVAPLDWGLGHTSRCVPIIRELTQTHNVYLAGNNRQKVFYEDEFGHLPFLQLVGYNVRYHSSYFQAWYLFRQSHSVFRAINREYRWLRKMQNKIGFDLIVSDNRYGLKLKGVRSVIVCHQLRLPGPAVVRWMGTIVNSWLVNKFSECWVPDFEDSNRALAGKLSCSHKLIRVPVKYLGPLSRFSDSRGSGGLGKPTRILILISGPEPQRTIFEINLLDILPANMDKVLVRGIPEKTLDENQMRSCKNLTVYNHLNDEQLLKQLVSANLVIGRAGYSTIMDFTVLGVKTLLIPTPGQWEQEYLAKHHAGRNCTLNFVAQKHLSLEAILEIMNACKHS